MNLITTTQLRTNTKELVAAFLAGQELKVIHRSKIIGVFKPVENRPLKVFDAKKFGEITKKLNLPHLTEEEREKRYRSAMEKKHGKGISR